MSPFAIGTLRAMRTFKPSFAAENFYFMARIARTLNVLLVEDSENDATLLLEELRQKGYTPIHERVQTSATMALALESREWDVVVSDYVMPEFSGPFALKLLREKKLDIPFIVVSGTYGEEAAVDMMKGGANDYITKANLSRLAPAIEREMEAAQSRAARSRAEADKQYLAAIVESSDDAIYGKNLDSLIVSWNPAAGRIYGYRAEEILGRSIAMLFPTNRRDELLDIMARIRRGEVVGFYETERLRKDGKVIPVSVTISPIKDGAGKTIGASSIAHDISKQKKDEEERQKLIRKLSDALGHVKLLTGLLPICASCKRIRDDHGYWQQVETYIRSHSEATFTHSICPECIGQYKAELESSVKT
jgi:two-component system cell cycle sensor histidine kinase/response regulator CckA